jgi:hypothetical protein
MSFGVDVLGTLTEKLKQMINESQNHYESFIKVRELYKKEEMSEKEFFDKIVNYVITISAANFLAIRVILELKSAMDKGTSMKERHRRNGISFYFAPSSFWDRRLCRYRRNRWIRITISYTHAAATRT